MSGASVGALLLAVLVAGCSAPPRDGADADVSMPDAALCGNGMVDNNGSEVCDDGARNGTSDSLCSKQCLPGRRTEPPNTEFVALGYPVVDSATVWFPDAHAPDVYAAGLAYTAFDDSGVHVIRDLRSENYDGIPPTSVALKQLARPVALGAVYVRDRPSGPGGVWAPLWIEAPLPGETAFHMYWADLTAGTPEVQEVPYPFTDGTRPSIVLDNELEHVVLVDQSSLPPHDLIVALIIVRGVGDVKTTTRRFPASGSVRGTVVETTQGSLDPGYTQQIVQFFDDTGTFIAFKTQPPANDPWAMTSDYALTETSRGSWPFRVVAGTDWYECDQLEPRPIAILADTGEVYLWQFSRGLDVEEFISPYARVAPGTQAFVTGNFTGLQTVWALEPDGTAAYLADSDCHDLRSPSLQSQRFHLTKPWMTSGILRFSGHPGAYRGGFTVDDTFRPW